MGKEATYFVVIWKSYRESKEHRFFQWWSTTTKHHKLHVHERKDENEFCRSFIC